MNWEAIGAIGELIGAVAVLATLIYLAIQIKDNTRHLDRTIQSTRTQNVYHISEVFDRWRAMLLVPGDMDIWVRGLNDLKSLDREESMRFTMIASQLIWSCWLMFHTIHEEDLIPDINEAVWQDLFKHPGYREWLINHRQLHSDVFGEFLDNVREAVGDVRYQPGEFSSLNPGGH